MTIPAIKARIQQRVLLTNLGYFWTPLSRMNQVLDRMMHEIFESDYTTKGAGHEWFYYADVNLSGPWIDLILQNWPRPEENKELKP